MARAALRQLTSLGEPLVEMCMGLIPALQIGCHREIESRSEIVRRMTKTGSNSHLGLNESFSSVSGEWP